MHVVQLSFHADIYRRPPEGLLEAWPSMTAVASATVRAGCRVTVVQAAHEDSTLERDGVTYCFRHVSSSLGRTARGTRWLGGFRELVAAITQPQPDIVHVQGLTAPVQTRLLTRIFRRVPILAQDHASYPPSGLRRRLHRWGFHDLSAVAFTAREQAQPFVDAGILRSDLPVFEVVEGSSCFTPGDQAAAREKCGLVGAPCLLWVGRLDGNKNPLTVLDAVDHVLPEMPDLRLWCLYSEAPLLDAVRARLQSSRRLREAVHLVGKVPHHKVEDFYQAADFFVLASRREGSGFSLIEALACGTTPLVTAIPSFRKITGDGEVGELFPVGDARTLARLLSEWARRDGPRLRQSARRHFEQHLSYDAIGRQLLNAYEALLRGR